MNFPFRVFRFPNSPAAFALSLGLFLGVFFLQGNYLLLKIFDQLA